MPLKTTAWSLQTRLAVVFLAAFACPLGAQTPAKGPASVQFTATTENVSGAGESIKIHLTGWSTDQQRDELVGAWNLTPSTATGGAAAAGRGGRAGRGAAAGAGAAAAGG